MHSIAGPKVELLAATSAIVIEATQPPFSFNPATQLLASELAVENSLIRHSSFVAPLLVAIAALPTVAEAPLIVA